ncbi:hypothetical protein ACLOJK_024362 [Asimina triloba]
MSGRHRSSDLAMNRCRAAIRPARRWTSFTGNVVRDQLIEFADGTRWVKPELVSELMVPYAMDKGGHVYFS